MPTFYLNPRASHAPYPPELQHILNIGAAAESRAWLKHWDRINMQGTPLRELPGLAARLGMKNIVIKDESLRSQVGSFKALGAPIALVRLLLRLMPEKRLNIDALFMGSYRELLQDITVISATDGNHGRALAAAAQSVGCPCVIVLHGGVSSERENAIADYGAKIIRIGGNYDESVEEAARLASENRWYVVSDTSYEGYEDIPRDVMQGYAIIGAEVIEQCLCRQETPAFSHVILQGGVGGFAAGVASFLWQYHGKHRPQLIVVEPREADCLYQSGIAGQPAKATGAVDSLMAGLACGECSPLAWKILQPCIDAFLVIEDEAAVRAMQVLAAGRDQDIPIIAGESGAAGLAGLQTLLADEQLKKKARLDHNAHVLLINTEGATSPSIYHQLVGENALSVKVRQDCWQNRRVK
ncbi:diaminopropionate ammonia-lyase [Desulfopila aestuarii]|uniref:Diaminopropionate ammonia-lyase n=1 Tax=Desulfopila aestuarii DSM 18488 TaxID=1121416 RepID=A0A1M7XWN6_9BACT|nr:diaminopropionate ammonia-lyase [Desulfopila aestuarii]SHO43189.1 diaminopropionate ammonia-lyase [Desulfopila aestuarii DSM 18488]